MGLRGRSHLASPSWRQKSRRAVDQIRQAFDTLLAIVLRQRPLVPSPDGRHIPLAPGSASPLTDVRRRGPYVSNSIRTARYTPWDFFPKQLIFQFSRLHNFYFLLLGIFQVLGWGTVGQFTSILPLLFFVLLTILKEGWDDWRRHRLDMVENSTPVTVLGKKGETVPRGWRVWEEARTVPRVGEEAHGDLCWLRKRWAEVAVGDVVRLGRDEAVPADVVLLHASGPNDTAYVETMALDGETNLKSRQVCPVLPRLDTIAALARCRATVVAEDPNPDLYRFDGRLTIGGGSGGGSGVEETRPLTSAEVAYRGSTVRNTECVVGLVVNTGEESKMRLNANQHPQAKRPALESALNRVVLVLVFYVVILSVGFTVGYLRWQDREEEVSWYLVAAGVPVHHIFFGFLILLNNVIPLSLYVTLELVKLAQFWLLNRDLAMYDEESDRRANCNTNSILENLGQVGYVFSDKTGTLTDNVMRFRKMSVAGTVWVHHGASGVGGPDGAIPEEGGALIEEEESLSPSPPSPIPLPSSSPPSPPSPPPTSPSSTSSLVAHIRQHPNSPFARRAEEYFLAMALCHTCLPEPADGEIRYQASSPDELALVEAVQELGYEVVERTSRAVTLAVAGERLVFRILDVIEFSSKRKRMSVVVRFPDGRIAVLCKGADSAILPRLRMSESARKRAGEARASVEAEHAMSRRSDQYEMRNSLVLQHLAAVAASPASPASAASAAAAAASAAAAAASAAAAAADRRRSLEAAKLHRDAGLGCSSPTAPRTSFDNGHHLLRRLPDGDGAVAECFRHLDAFAAEGLRTLVYAQRIVSEDEYAGWKTTFDAASRSLVDRQDRVEEAGELLEQGFDLLGASAIEDKLQRGVPQTVVKLRRAGIKIWMLTGDKRETAINIAHAAGICRPASEVHVLDAEKNGGSSLRWQLDALSADLLSTSSPGAHSVVVVDGHTLGEIEKCPGLSESFFGVAPLVDSVVCCRASPAQKALLVRSVRARIGTSRGLTLAVGDGANDLAMIEASHVGVGISGREGLQAARVADYSIARFRFLQRLLLVHGRWNYVRTAKFVLGTFWKEMFFYLPTALYQSHNGFSGTSLYHETSLTVFNTLFTSLCLLYMGAFEQDLRAETLLAVPELYAYGRRGLGMTYWRYAGWMANAIAHGAVAWFFLWLGLGCVPGTGDQGLFALSHAAFSVGVLWVNFKLFVIETHYKTWAMLACILVTTVGWWAWSLLLDGVYAPTPTPYQVYHTLTRTFGTEANWWAVVAAALVAMGTVDVAARVVVQAARTWAAARDWGRWCAGGEEPVAAGEGEDLGTDEGISSVSSGSASAGSGSVQKGKNGKTVRGFRTCGVFWGRPGISGGGETEEGLGRWDVGLWQEIERREGVRERFEAMAREEGV